MRSRQLVIAFVVVFVLAVAAGGAYRFVAARRLRAELDQARAEMGAGLFNLASDRLARLGSGGVAEGEVALLLGRCAAARGKPEDALRLWAGISPDSGWSAEAGLESAQTALRLRRISEAQRVLQKALKRPSPHAAALRHLLLVLLGQQGRFDEARKLLEDEWRDTSILPTSDVAARIGLLREHVGLDFEPFPLEGNLKELEAGSGTEAGGEISATDHVAMALARAYLATREGDFERAQRELRFCVKQQPDDVTVWKSWLNWSVASDRFESAREAMQHLPAWSLDDGEILALRAWLARQRQDSGIERRALEQLLEIEPGRAPALARLAELLQQDGDLQGAARLSQRKAELDKDVDRYARLYKENRYSDHLEELAHLAGRLGRTFEARACWELICARQPSRPLPALAPARLRATIAPRVASSRTLAQVLADVLGPAISPGRLPAREAPRARMLVPHFDDRARAAGLAGFVLDNGSSPIHQLPEAFCGGLALLDFDRDGFLDVYCVQGGPFPPDPSTPPAGDRLFRNRGDGRFEDVTVASGIGAMKRGYGHGVSVGDCDNDGYPDIFVTRWRAYALYHNRGDGTFEEVTRQAGLGGERDWPTSSAFADLDNDGDLDLYVCHYGDWDALHPRVCKDPSGRFVTACDPRLIGALPDHVFRNDAGRFVDVTAEAGIVDRDGRGLGVAAADFDGDGRMDVFVANDSTANYLFINRGGFRFAETGQSAGVAANAQGGYQAGMGVACGDLDGDGRIDLAVTNFHGESTTFFRNVGHGLFADHTAAVGLAAPSRGVLGFGAAFLDVNNDGRLDLMTANGHISDLRPLFPCPMPAQLYLGGEGGRLRDVTGLAGPPFRQLYVGRGLAAGDLDNDGRVDAIMVAQNDPLVFFHNGAGSKAGQFVTFRLEGRKSNRDGVGATVAIRAGGRKQVAQRAGGGSYQSAHDGRLHFGLGPSMRVEAVEVRWPSGQVDRYEDLAASRGYCLIEGDPSPKILEGFPP